MKKHFILFLSLCFSLYSYPISEREHITSENEHILISGETSEQNEGFIVGTLIKTNNGYTAIENLSEGDLIIGYDPLKGHIEKPIIRISKKQISLYIAIWINNDVMYAAPNQKFYIPGENDWIDAKDLKLSTALTNGLNSYLHVEHIDQIHLPINSYYITVEDHNFFITPYDILVHNSNAHSETISCAILILEIGQMAIQHPVIKIIGSTAIGCLNLYRALPARRIPNDTTTKTSTIPERTFYEKLKSELLKLRNDFVKIKEELEYLVKYQRPNGINLTNSLLNQIKFPISHSPDLSSMVSIDRELLYSEEQKINLRKLRQAELDQLEHQVLELQISLAFHFNELIEAKNKAIKEYYDAIPTINKAIFAWNNNLNQITNDIAISQYDHNFIWQDLLRNIESKNNELKIAIEYYKNIDNGLILKKTTNISELITQEEKSIISTGQLIHNSKATNLRNLKNTEKLLIERNINIRNLANNIDNKIKQQRALKDSEQITQSQKRLNSLNPILPPDEPKKNNDEDGEPKIKIFEKNAKHIFRNKAGHLADTPENRQLFIDLVSDTKNLLGPCNRGNMWYGKILPDGKQLWASVRDGYIRNCGLNDIPHIYNPKTGLSLFIII